jgi:hypothetical protein
MDRRQEKTVSLQLCILPYIDMDLSGSKASRPSLFSYKLQSDI